MTRRLFSIVIALAVLSGIYLFISKEAHSKSVLISAATFIFLVYSFGIHGLIAHAMPPPDTKGKLILFPLLMWVLWAVMFLAFVFLVLPIYCPDFVLEF